MEEIILFVYRNTIRKESFQGRNTRRMGHFQDINTRSLEKECTEGETLSVQESNK